jgi:hypothetical protein
MLAPCLHKMSGEGEIQSDFTGLPACEGIPDLLFDPRRTIVR